MSNTLMTSPFGSAQLLRRPRRPREMLQAWDAADLLLLQHMADQPPDGDEPVLLVNDRFGALAVALQQGGYRCVSWGDSAVAQLATAENTGRNGAANPQFLPATEVPTGQYSRIFFRLPKSHSLLRFQLERLIDLVNAGVQLIGARMVKHIDRPTIDLIDSIAGPTQPSLAWKKARLIFFGEALSPVDIQEDRQVTNLPEWHLALSNRANVFSRGKLDRGSRLLIGAMPQLSPPGQPRIADLGCGNGLLGLRALHHWPQAQLHFFDDSFLAIDSARENMAAHYPTTKAQFCAGDGMTAYQGATFDLVLCNPPFHQEYDLGDHIARQMFRDAHRHLSPDGQLCVVGNRHLGYHQDLKRLFGKVEVIASDPKFVVLLAKK